MGDFSSASDIHLHNNLHSYIQPYFNCSLMRDYFASLGDSAHPESTDIRARAITRFQELLLVSFREFSVITDDTIISERRKFRGEIIHSIESFSKRSAVRNLKSLGRFNKEQAGFIYDALYKAMCIVPPPAATTPPPSLFTTNDGHEEKPETRIELRTFQYFLSEVATWARDEKIVLNGFQVSSEPYDSRPFFIAYHDPMSATCGPRRRGP